MEESKSLHQKLFEIKSAWIKLQRDTKAFNYKYATLSQIQEKFWEELQKQKLVIIHYVKDNKVVTLIQDTESTQNVSSEIEMSHDTKAQDKWSEITYYRRYNLLSLLDLEVEDDDGKTAQESKPIQKAKVELPTIQDSNIDALRKLIEAWKTVNMSDVTKKYKLTPESKIKLESMWIN